MMGGKFCLAAVRRTARFCEPPLSVRMVNGGSWLLLRRRLVQQGDRRRHIRFHFKRGS